MASLAGRHRKLSRVIVGAVFVVAWNGVFDSRMKQGIWDYVDRQQRFVAGQGPYADIDAAMDAAISRGLRDATLSALAASAVAAVAARKSRGGRA